MNKQKTVTEAHPEKTNDSVAVVGSTAGSIPGYTFKICQVNLNRMRRGAEAVQIEVLENGEPCERLWMSRSDIKKNIQMHGDCEAFTTALEIYRTQRDVREQRNKWILTAYCANNGN